MIPIVQTLMLFAVLVPAKMDVAPSQPILISAKSDRPVALVLTDMNGTTLGHVDPDRVPLDKPLDLRGLFPTLQTPGVYILRAAPTVDDLAHFRGTPLVLTVQADNRIGASTAPIVTHIDPLTYATIQTAGGPMTMVFYYEAAPHTVQNFQTLAQRGYYDGLTFHRIIPGFIIQGGDPTGAGMGGPGYSINAEFANRRHLRGVVSMARAVDPNEKAGSMPRTEFANSAGGQFFIVLDDAQAGGLDGRYTAFGRIVDGLDVLDKLAATPLADPSTGRPATLPVIESVKIHPVTAADNPYRDLLDLQSTERSTAATLPAGMTSATQPIAAPSPVDQPVIVPASP